MHKWLPWKFIVKYVARSRGFIDPIALYSQLQKFSQPSEVGEPVELLRAGVVFHARGLVNSKVLQHNLDWVWPYWVEKQFDPNDPAFLPRAFSITHVNLTHRNWTAIGLPNLDTLPIVDPRGLLTPIWDGWSIDVWMIGDDNELLLPSRTNDCEQKLLTSSGVAVETTVQEGAMKLVTRSEVRQRSGDFICTLSAEASADQGGWLVVSARPYNPEGVSFIEDIKLSQDRCRWTINRSDTVRFSRPVERSHMSHYKDADVYIHLLDKEDNDFDRCPVGMATGAAMYRFESGQTCNIDIEIPIPALDSGSSQRARINHTNSTTTESAVTDSAQLWNSSLAEKCTLSIPDNHFQFLYEAAVRTLILCTPGDIYAGPYTYKRFWYRDAVFITHGLLSAGLISRAARIIKQLPLGQKHNGYFHSQEGEWDSNGEVLWLMGRYCHLSGSIPDADMWSSVVAGADWIIKKRLPNTGKLPWDGLLPAGFSAEHLGPNDYYYWDDYWAIAGLEAAAQMASMLGKVDHVQRYNDEAASLRDAVDQSIEKIQNKLRRQAIPASPTRRLDAGAIGSVIASYPLQLYPEHDDRLLGTIEFLLENCFYHGGFFQDMIHSGVNAYLTLQVAQVLLRAGDNRYFDLMKAIADLSSPTGHWPEAIHPATGGGCMGDGHHAWAAAEWIAMIRNCFVREEGQTLVLGSGIPADWLLNNQTVSFGSVPTCFGSVSVSIVSLDNMANTCEVTWETEWHDSVPKILVSMPGFKPVEATGSGQSIIVQRETET